MLSALEILRDEAELSLGTKRVNTIGRNYASTGYAPFLSSEKNALEDSETLFISHSI